MPKYELHIIEKEFAHQVERNFRELIEGKAKDGWRVHSQSIARYKVGYDTYHTLSVLLIKD